VGNLTQNISTFSESGLDVYFQSARAHVDGNATVHLAEFIKSAKERIDCAIYDLKDPDVVDALKSVAGKVTLRIAYDGGKQKEVTGGPSVDPKPKGTAQIIEESGLSEYATAIHVSGGHLMHSKYIIRDDYTVWTGSGNWTHGGLDLQDNNFLVVKSRELANAYKANFDYVLSESHVHPRRTKRSGMAHLHSSNQAINIENVSVTPYFSGGGTEEIEDVIVSLINNATKLRIIAMLVSDPGILQAISKFKPESKDIKGVLDPHEIKQVMSPPKGKPKIPSTLFWFARRDKRFVAAPSHPYSKIDNNDFMHNKVIIIDDRMVVTGSYNFSENAESNDENMLILESSRIADAYTQYFDRLFEQYQKHGAPLPPR
jgi:phosphatidylserine/phosphatidylglycerophosphate/cardiolipin synthase-like enzyme